MPRGGLPDSSEGADGAATKGSNLFDEIYSSCYESNSTESYLDPLILSKSILPPDVVRSGQDYQNLVPESFQVIQKLSDKCLPVLFLKSNRILPSIQTILPCVSTNLLTMVSSISNQTHLIKACTAFLC